MNRLTRFGLIPAFLLATTVAPGLRAEDTPKIPRFSVDLMDRSVDPSADFYHYAAGTWLKNNPVPSDKSRWSGFEELQQRNWFQVRQILESSAAGQDKSAVGRKVGDFFASAMDTNRIEALGLKPLARDLRRIEAVDSPKALFKQVAEFHDRDIACAFGASVSPDEKNSAVYAFELRQGGLGLPDRDNYLTDAFAKQREAYRAHVAKMLGLLGESPADAAAHAGTILDLETAMAKASKSRTDLRDPIANYHKFPVSELIANNPNLPWAVYLGAEGLGKMRDLVVRQPEFFAALDGLVKERPMSDWRVYLRWHLLRSTAPYLDSAAETESFAFYGTTLRGQPANEPRWQRAARRIDGSIGEALGQLYVEKYFTATARARMNELVNNLRAVFRERLQKVDWMSPATRAKALVKFDRFTQKIGHPDKFRDYSPVKVKRDDFLGNVERAAIFDSRRQLARVGKPVDKSEWEMTPQTVNAYFNPLYNEIVFPAGILQPPFFDVEADDAVNYGAIGVVIGHEITHGYDDQGRKYDADGNLNDWWTEADGKEFDARAKRVVEQYGNYEALPGLKVNGKLTLGENIADLGGTSIAFEAMERALAKDPSKRKKIDGFTPEQRFFISLAQLWRTNWREAELRRRITVDPHSPGQFRAVGAHVNNQSFYDAFHIKPGTAMYTEPDKRAKIW
ncbi:MAG TPA: M13 family metallopeptidase [Verrucomicrobiae bacterium]|nr:M13 family metallopeptidase [Verrucomicrobiae bacterium]